MHDLVLIIRQNSGLIICTVFVSKCTGARVNNIDVLSYWAWHRITSFIDHAIQTYVRQKDNANQWKVTVLEEFLHAVLLYQAVTVRIINALAIF